MRFVRSTKITALTIAVVALLAVALAACGGSEPPATPTATPTATPGPQDDFVAWTIRWSANVESEVTTVKQQLRALAFDPSDSKIATLRASVSIWERLLFSTPDGAAPTPAVSRLVNSAQRSLRQGVDSMKNWMLSPTESLELEIAEAFIQIGLNHALNARDEAVRWKNSR